MNLGRKRFCVILNIFTVIIDDHAVNKIIQKNIGENPAGKTIGK